MLVQVVGEAPLRRETRTTEANKQRDFLSTPGSSSQEETDGPTPSQNSKRKRLEQDRGSTKKRKVCEIWGPDRSGALWLHGWFPVHPVSVTSCWDFIGSINCQWLRAFQSPLPTFHISVWPDALRPLYLTDTSVPLYQFILCLNQFIYTEDGCSTFLLSVITFNQWCRNPK